MADTAEILIRIVREHLGIDLAEQPTGIDTKINAAPVALDSLDIVELSMAIEDEFSIVISDDEIEPFAPDAIEGKTFGDLVTLIDGKRG